MLAKQHIAVRGCCHAVRSDKTAGRKAVAIVATRPQQFGDGAVWRPLTHDVADDVAEPQDAGRPPQRPFGECEAPRHLLDSRVGRNECVEARVDANDAHEQESCVIVPSMRAHPAVRILIAQGGGQSMLAHVVVTLQHREAAQRRWNPHGRKPRMAGRRERATMIHRGADGDTRRHLVVQQSAHLLAQPRAITSYAASSLPAGIRIDAAGQIALRDDRRRGPLRRHRRNDDAQRRIAKRLGLQLRAPQGTAYPSRAAACSDDARRSDGSRRQHICPGTAKRLHAVHDPFATPADSSAGGCAASNELFTSP